MGDAGYNKDPITAQGITDAFLDSERCTRAQDDSFTGARPFDEAMRDYQRAHDEHVRSMYEFTCQLATLEPPPCELQELFRAIYGNQHAMDRFVQMNAGTISPAEFFSAENVRAMLSAGRRRHQRADRAPGAPGARGRGASGRQAEGVAAVPSLFVLDAARASTGPWRRASSPAKNRGY